MKMLNIALFTLLISSQASAFVAQPKNIVFQETIGAKRQFTLPKIDLTRMLWSCESWPKYFYCSVKGKISLDDVVVIGNSSYKGTLVIRGQFHKTSDLKGHQVQWDDVHDYIERGGNGSVEITLEEIETKSKITISIEPNGSVALMPFSDDGYSKGRIVSYY
ncbi:MAG: hypothetical protein CME64_03055 [Halobacteriovoraceae bacterium]|nr:hypothetical protein [Halobacteriovoraceae bacterium]|tara:strand:+ start:135 stop:620 length:486 start_codon:yes stop_codon:yes gene_type:complete